MVSSDYSTFKSLSSVCSFAKIGLTFACKTGIDFYLIIGFE